MRKKGINAAAWFYGQSFNGRTALTESLERSIEAVRTARAQCEAVGSAVEKFSTCPNDESLKAERPGVGASSPSLNDQPLTVGDQHSMSHLKVIRSTERIDVQHPLFLLIGMPGLGKSSLGYSCEKPVALNFDSESAQARTVNRGDSINVLTVEALNELEEHGHPSIDEAATVIWDTVGAYIELLKVAVVEENPKCRNKSGGLTFDGWNAIARHFKALFGKFRAAGKNQFLITHAKEQEDNGTKFYRPQIDGAARDFVIQQADFVGFLHIVGKERVLDFNPTESWHGKNPGQWSPLIVPQPDKARTFMTQLFQMGREALGKISETSSSVANSVLDWKAAIEMFATLEDFNRAVPEVLKLNATALPQVAHLIRTRGKACGFEYDVNRKLFYIAEPAKELVMAL